MKIEKLSPAFKDYLWGGTKLRDVYGKKCDYEKVAESWELSTHPAGQSVIDGAEIRRVFGKSRCEGARCERCEI